MSKKGLVLLESPTPLEVQLGKYAMPTENKELFSMLRDVGLSSKDLTVMYVFDEPKAKILAKDINEARTEVQDSIAKIKPDYILSCGLTPTKVLTKYKTLTKYRGQLVDNILITLNPSVLSYQLNNKPLFKADVLMFKQLLTGSGLADYSDFRFIPITDISDIGSTTASYFMNSEIAYDVETTGLDPATDEITMLGVCVKMGAIYNCLVFLGTDCILEGIRLLSKVKRTIAHNGAFDNSFINKHLTPTMHIHTSYDTMLAGYSLDESLPHGLKFMARAYCGADFWDNDIDFATTPLEEQAEYCAKDCYWTYKLREHQLPLLLDSPVANTFVHVVAKGSTVLEKIKSRGIHIDTVLLHRNNVDLELELQGLTHKLNTLLPVGYTGVNYNSPNQLKAILYDGFKLPKLTDSYSGKELDSTNKATLRKYARDGSEFCKALLKHRTISKMLNGFIHPFIELTKDTPRIYPNYNIARTSTGRLSANDPNLQQVSRDKRVRNLISVPNGYTFIEADYSQIELRIASYIGNIESMKKLYRTGQDIHTNTAKMMADLGGVDWDSLGKPTKKLWRFRAKAVNFGFIYGMSANGFMEYADTGYDIVLNIHEASTYRDAFFNLYPELIEWHNKCKYESKKTKQCVSPFGRVRHLANIDSNNSYERSKAERCSINTPVQSVASDLTILSMIELDDILPDTCKIVGQCHDAIFFENKDTKFPSLYEVCETIKDTMENINTLKLFGVDFDIPIVAEVKVGSSWGAGEDYEI